MLVIFYNKYVSFNMIELIIPKIGFDKILYDSNVFFNDVDYNVEILDNSDINNNLFFLASHSGNCDSCYFNKLKELEIFDYVYVVNNGKKVTFIINNKYFIIKSGNMEISYKDRDYIYLITCDIYNNNRQLILEGTLVN